MSNSKSNLRESFRPALKVQNINQLKKTNPNLRYKQVRYDEILDSNGDRIDRYLDKGWQIVSSTDTLADDRSTAPKSKDTESLRPKPMTKKGKGGAEFVVMSIPKEEFAANQLEKKAADDAKYLASSKKKISRSGDSVRITDSDITESNVNNTNNSEE